MIPRSTTHQTASTALCRKNAVNVPLSLTPHRQYRLADGAAKLSIDDARCRNAHTIPEQNLRLGGHGLTKGKNIAEGQNHSDRIKIGEFFFNPSSRNNGSQIRSIVAPQVADTFIKFTEEPLIGWG